MQTHSPPHVARHPLFSADVDQFGGKLDTFPLIRLLVIQVRKWDGERKKSQVTGCGKNAHRQVGAHVQSSELFFLCFKEDDWMLAAIVISLITSH